MKQATIFTVAIVGLGLLLAPVAANAGGGKGPRASVSVATVCALDGTDFTVELRIRDKTSGDAIPLVTAWNIDFSYLTRGVPGNQWQTFSSDSEGGIQLGVPVTITSTSSLCAFGGGIRAELDDARAINGLAEVTYGTQRGTSVVDERTIRNRCSDDPMTEAIEPAGIKLTAADLAAIDAACTP